jgi:hypothetical protein
VFSTDVAGRHVGQMRRRGGQLSGSFSTTSKCEPVGNCINLYACRQCRL